MESTPLIASSSSSSSSSVKPPRASDLSSWSTRHSSRRLRQICDPRKSHRGPNLSRKLYRYAVGGIVALLMTFGLWTSLREKPRSKAYYLCDSEDTESSAAAGTKRRTSAAGISLLTHASAEDTKLERMRYQIERWGGPVSAGILVRSDEEEKTLRKFQRDLDASGDLERVQFTVLREEPGGLYPHNILRNLAQNNSRTDYIMTSDADFMPPPGSHGALARLLFDEPICDDAGTRTHTGLAHADADPPHTQARTPTPVAFVLPALEFTEKPSVPGDNVSSVPNSVFDVLDMVQRGDIRPMRLDFWFPGQGATDYPRWLAGIGERDRSGSADSSLRSGSADSSLDLDLDRGRRRRRVVAYDIRYQLFYEPYLVANRHEVPQFDNDLRGYGYDKSSWLLEMSCRGFEFRTLSDFFVVHLSHPMVVKSDREALLGRNEPIWRRFKERMRSEYKCKF